MASKKHVVVIGAGVTGLTSAIFLAEAGYAVTIVAAHVPGDSSIEYTSPWAGAHWLTHATPAEPMLCDWDIQTYDFWLDLLRREGEDRTLPRSGLRLTPGHKYWHGAIEETLWWAPHVRDFQQLPTETGAVAAINAAAPPSTPRIRNAVAFTSVSINVPAYLLYLQERARQLGCAVVKAALPTASGLDGALAAAADLARGRGGGAAAAVDCFVNATGLGAARLCGDAALYPIRGQTVLVRGEARAERTRSGDGGFAGYSAYCIPRPGAGMTILGGTREEGEWSEAPDAGVTRRILERNAWQAPELLTGPDGGFEVVSVQCGLRPGRKGGPRMEREMVGGRRVVHAYGHAGAGYQNSIGSARMVVALVRESLEGGGEAAKL